jgi:hypothetical protein
MIRLHHRPVAVFVLLAALVLGPLVTSAAAGEGLSDVCTAFGQQDDPGCPIVTPPGKQEQCEVRESCWSVWNERCTDGSVYSCGTSLTVPCCVEDPSAGGPPPSVVVTMDVKPGQRFTPIDPERPELLLVAVLTTDAFDAATIDRAMVAFGASGQEAAPVLQGLVDVDKDGRPDLLLTFHLQDTGITCDTPAVALTATTTSGEVIRGIEAIQTVGCR